MPALVNSRVGSLRGTKGEDGTTLWPRSAKNSRNPLRTSERLFMGPVVTAPKNLVTPGFWHPRPQENGPEKDGAARADAPKNRGRPSFTRDALCRGVEFG